MTTEEIEIVGEMAGFFPSRPLMLGILASDKTLCGQTNNHPNRHPPPRQFNKLVQAIGNVQRTGRNVFSAVHYHTLNRQNFLDKAREILVYTGYEVDAIQLNIAWPDLNEIHTFRYHDKLFIILQIGPIAMSMLDNDPERIAEKAIEYSDLVDTFLVDVSGGTGQLFSADFAQRFLRPLSITVGSDRIAVAGGLCANTLDVVRLIVEEFPNISIDAEGRLRRPSDDTLDLKETERYVRAARELFDAPYAAG